MQTMLSVVQHQISMAPGSTEELDGALENVNALNGYTYNYKADADKEKQLGVIAQEIEAIYPELITTNEQGYKMVNYTGLIPVLLQAIKEQQQIIEQLTAALDDEQRNTEELKAALERQQELFKLQSQVMVQVQEENKSMQNDLKLIKAALGLDQKASANEEE